MILYIKNIKKSIIYMYLIQFIVNFIFLKKLCNDMMYQRYNNKLINKKKYKLIEYFIIIYVGGFSKYILCILFF